MATLNKFAALALVRDAALAACSLGHLSAKLLFARLSDPVRKRHFALAIQQANTLQVARLAPRL